MEMVSMEESKMALQTTAMATTTGFQTASRITWPHCPMRLMVNM